MDAPVLHLAEYGVAGLLATFERADRPGLWAAARSLESAMIAAAPAGLVDTVASFESLYIGFDPIMTDHARMSRWVHELAGAPMSGAVGRLHELPVTFGGDAGPDLDLIGREVGLSASAVVALVCDAEWIVRLIGSPLGAPLLDRADLPAAIPPIRRMATPRTRLLPGSLGLSGHQAVIYPLTSPGGWRLIGRTSAELVRTTPTPAVLLEPGDRVLFRPENEHLRVSSGAAVKPRKDKS